jgi:hypothetical protein
MQRSEKMKDICILVGWQRPEYMELCLERIVLAEGSENLLYYVLLDNGFDPKYLDLFKSFPYEHILIKREKSGYKLGKQSYNVISGLLSASISTDKYVYYVEEDILISKDFFTYCNSALKEDAMCVLGSRDNEDLKYQGCDVNGYYFGGKKSYQCWGSAWKKENLLKYLQPHYVTDYFYDPISYIRNNFPNNEYGTRFCEQDGLTKRIMMQNDLRCIFPVVPRCYHAGFYGYNRPGIRPPKHEDRVKLLRSIVFSPAEMKKYDKLGDSKPVDLNINEKTFELCHS